MTFVKGQDNICGNPDGVCIAMDSEGTCEDCEGSGRGYAECRNCEGHGHIYTTMDSLPIGYDPEDTETVAMIWLEGRGHCECPTCEGWGIVCGTCRGLGYCSDCIV